MAAESSESECPSTAEIPEDRASGVGESPSTNDLVSNDDGATTWKPPPGDGSADVYSRETAVRRPPEEILEAAKSANEYARVMDAGLGAPAIPFDELSETLNEEPSEEPDEEDEAEKSDDAPADPAAASLAEPSDALYVGGLDLDPDALEEELVHSQRAPSTRAEASDEPTSPDDDDPLKSLDDSW